MHLCPGSEENIKLTTPLDFELAGDNQQPQEENGLRVGYGYMTCTGCAPEDPGSGRDWCL